MSICYNGYMVNNNNKADMCACKMEAVLSVLQILHIVYQGLAVRSRVSLQYH